MLIFPTSTGAPRTQSAAVPRPIENGERGGVLVVDDNDSVRRVVRRAMEHQGYHVLVADGGHEAEELLREHGAEVRLALVDLTMPGLGGIETVQRLIGIQPALSVVLMSGYSAEDVTSTFEGHMAGIHGFLQKPFRVQDLLEVVRDTIDRHTH